TRRPPRRPGRRGPRRSRSRRRIPRRCRAPARPPANRRRGTPPPPPHRARRPRRSPAHCDLPYRHAIRYVATMRLLILGGTAFLGRAVARHALAEGHEVTCAARGTSGAPPAGAAFVPVDRDDPDGLAKLGGHEFDALLDVTSRPSHARRGVAAFADRVPHVTYVSTGSASADRETPGQRG